MTAIFLCVFFIAHAAVFAIALSKPVGYVNDFAGVLQPAARAEIEAALRQFEAETSNEIVIVIVNDFQGLDRFSFSQALFDEWKPGKDGRDNGIIFLIGPKEGLPFPERGEAFLNIGKGLEGVIPDGLAGNILRTQVFPEFKEQHFDEGVRKGIAALMQASRGEYEPVSERRGSQDGFSIEFLFWPGFILLSYLGSFLARSKSWWLGGVVGGVGGAALGFVLWTGIFIFISAAVLGGFGAFFDFLVSRNYAERKRRGLPTDFWHSGGGFWFGGGMGHGGGGFGGFGGGGSGGGGAGGSW